MVKVDAGGHAYRQPVILHTFRLAVRHRMCFVKSHFR